MRRDRVQHIWICACNVCLLAILMVPFLSPDIFAAAPPPISAGQFVYAPAEAEWDIEAALIDLDSPMAQFAGDVEIYALMSSVDPRILLAALEVEDGYVTAQGRLNRSAVLAALEDMSRRLSEAFYVRASLGETYGEEAGAYALNQALGAQAESTFSVTVRRLFPDFDPLDRSNEIEVTTVPPAGLLQFPFPLGEAWQFNGTHGWARYSEPPSSMDFSRQWPQCGLPAYDEVVVSAGEGTLRKPRSYADCWLEIDHAGGWTTSYYHLTDVERESGPVAANVPLGRVGCETCVGGFATAAHVHFSLKHNGAYVSLEGVSLSGWMVHVGSAPYATDTWLSREDLVYSAYTRLLNDGGECGLIGAPMLITPAHGTQLDSTTVAVYWEPPAGEPTPASYVVRVRTVADMESGSGDTVFNQRVTWTSGTIQLPAGYENRELFWSVQAWRQGACSLWAPARQFRLGAAPTPNPSHVMLPLVLKKASTWPAYPTATATATSTPTVTRMPTGAPVPTATATATPSATLTSTATASLASPTPTATLPAVSLEREAEDGQLAWPMQQAYDAEASGLYFVHTPAGNPAAGLCRLTFDLPQSGTWQLWARGMGVDADADELLVMIDSGAPIVWQIPIGGWSWQLIATVDLDAGEHAISFVTSEVESRLDVVKMVLPGSLS